MRRFYCIGFFWLMVFDTLAQTCFKLAGESAAPLEMDIGWVLRILSSPWAYGALVCYLGSFAAWITLLRYAPLGPAFAASNMELISVTIVSVWLFHEPLNSYKIAGGLLIILGVLFLASEENARHHPKKGHGHAAENTSKA